MSNSLPYHQMENISNMSLYVINQPIVVTSGISMPWFGQYGGGVQYVLPQIIQELLDSGVISVF